MELAEYIKTYHGEAHDEYVRFTTPNYYEPNIAYHPITNGMGCGFEGSKEPFEMVNGTYMRDGDIHIKLQSKIKPDRRIIINKSEIHTKLKKLDETQMGIGMHIPNDKSLIYMNIDGVDYTIWQNYWRNHNDKTLGGRVIIRRSSDKLVKTNYGEKQPYFELYSHFGSTWTFKHVYSYDSANREQYDIKFKTSVRDFKEKVFGNPNVKFKCDLFSHL